MKNKFKLVIYFETNEEGDTSQEGIDNLLEGSWLYDSSFDGAISSKRLVRRK